MTAQPLPNRSPAAAMRAASAGPCRVLIWVILCGLFSCSAGCSLRKSGGGLSQLLGGRKDSISELGRRFSAEERQQILLCRDAFDDKDYETAISRCRDAADKFSGSSLGEEALYLLAESYFAQEKYPKAQDHYQQLFSDYPSTRYVEPVTARLYHIATRWLQIPQQQLQSDIRQVSVEQELPAESQRPSDPTLRYRILPNLHDRTRPVFDTQGRALQALKAIWMNDPTGPLADDALMLTANYYQQRRNYVESDRYYRILREEYPDSQYLEAAFLLGGHALQASYQGPMYDGEDLMAARRLKQQSLYLFPASAQRQQIRKDLGDLEQLEAERLYAMVDYYQRKENPRAVAIACVKVMTAFPESPLADEARKVLLSLDRTEIDRLPEIGDFLDSLGTAASSERSEVDQQLRSKDYDTIGRARL